MLMWSDFPSHDSQGSNFGPVAIVIRAPAPSRVPRSSVDPALPFAAPARPPPALSLLPPPSHNNLKLEPLWGIKSGRMGQGRTDGAGTRGREGRLARSAAVRGGGGGRGRRREDHMLPPSLLRWLSDATVDFRRPPSVACPPSLPASLLLCLAPPASVRPSVVRRNV